MLYHTIASIVTRSTENLNNVDPRFHLYPYRQQALWAQVCYEKGMYGKPLRKDTRGTKRQTHGYVQKEERGKNETTGRRETQGPTTQVRDGLDAQSDPSF